MKNSFTLVEVIISVTILSIVIAATLQIRQDNLAYLEKFKNSKKNNQYISIATLYQDKKKQNINTNFYLDDIIKFKDDNIRKKLKQNKIFLKTKIINNFDLSSESYDFKIQTHKKTYKINDKISKNFYTFKLMN